MILQPRCGILVYMKRIYLDYSATTPVDKRVVEAMMPYWSGTFGNASSVHGFGREARLVLEESRETIARFIGAKTDELYFTSGGTESDNHALKGVAAAAKKSGRQRILVSAIEHHAILEPAEFMRSEGFDVEVIPVGESGIVDPDVVRKLMTPTTALVSVMHANNEIGTIQPVRAIADIAHEFGALMHTDAVQTVGKIPVNVNELGVDLLSLSAHKIYGPKGIGASFIRKGTAIESFMKGGAQESNRRAGTENVASAAGFAKAVELCSDLESEQNRLRSLKSRLKEIVLATSEGWIVNGAEDRSLPNILNVSFDSSVTEIDGEALIMGMDLRGVAVTSGSACTSGSLQPSHVLLAMGRYLKTARATIRFSMGRWTTEEEIEYAADALRDVLKTVRKPSAVTSA